MITIKQLSKDDIEKMGIRSWPVWEKEISEFDWHYDKTEECLLLEGEVEVITDDGNYQFKAGDYVTFKTGLKCHWIIRKPVLKHYRFL